MKLRAIYNLLFVSLFAFGSLFLSATLLPTQVSAQYEYNPNDVAVSGIISCYNECDFSDIFRTVNNIIYFLITIVFIPVVVIMFMYAGYTYITAGGDSKKVVKVRSLLKHIVLGMVIILCAWLIVRTFMSVLVRDTGPGEVSPNQFLID